MLGLGRIALGDFQTGEVFRGRCIEAFRRGRRGFSAPPRAVYSAAEGKRETRSARQYDGGERRRHPKREAEVHDRDDGRDKQVDQIEGGVSHAIDFGRQDLRVVGRSGAYEVHPPGTGDRAVHATVQRCHDFALYERVQDASASLQEALEPDRSDVDRQHQAKGESQSDGVERGPEHRDATGERALRLTDADELQEWNQQEQSDALRGAQDERDQRCLGHLAG